MSSIKDRISGHITDRNRVDAQERQLLSEIRDLLDGKMEQIRQKIPEGYESQNYEVRIGEGYKPELCIDPPSRDRMMMNVDQLRELNESLRDTYQEIEEAFGIRVRGFTRDHLHFA